MQVEVVTAVHGGYTHFIPDAWRSLRQQTHSDWRWLIQVDGPDSKVIPRLIACGALDDPRVDPAVNGTHEGPAVTRNIALARASAPLIQNLDADDELEPEALAVAADALGTHPDAGFAVGPVRDLLSSGALVHFPIPFEPGPIPRGALIDHWVAGPDDYRLPVHPAAVMWRRELLLTAGGWAGLRNMEDTALLMAASALAPGIAVEAPTLRYRKHRGQRSTQVSQFKGGGEQISLIRQRAAVLLAGPAWRPSSLYETPRDAAEPA